MTHIIAPVPGQNYTTINPVQITGVDTVGVVRTVGVVLDGSVLVTPGSGGADAFGRMRVSAPATLLRLLYQYDTQPLFMQFSNVGTGSTVKTTNESSLTLSTGGTASGASAIAQTKEYFAYEPGKSQLVMMSGLLGAQKANVTARIGYYDVNNGVYFEQAGAIGLSVVIRTSTSGSVVETRVPQASWNIDKMDGTGISGITLDPTKTQIFAVDFEWLGAGRVRFGFFLNNVFMYCHTQAAANTLVSPYTNTGCLPCRAEIFNTAVSASTTTMKLICLSVISEGGQEKPVLLNFGASNGATGLATTTRRPILSVRPKLLFAGQTNRGRIFLSDLTILTQGQGSVLYELVYNGTLTGSSFSSVDPNSLVEKDTSATAITGGTVYKVGYTSNNQQVTQVDPLCRYPFTLDISGSVQDIITIVATAVPTSNTPAVTASVSWEELR
jgi:hypothetical protein